MVIPDDIAAGLVLDGNAVAGELEELLGSDMTAALHRCANCGNRGAMATLLAYTGGPGTVLRCSICHEVVLRLVRTPTATYLDLRGAAYVSMGAADAESG
jgi:LSD1 subclass zinc finger protein